MDSHSSKANTNSASIHTSNNQGSSKKDIQIHTSSVPLFRLRILPSDALPDRLAYRQIQQLDKRLMGSKTGGVVSQPQTTPESVSFVGTVPAQYFIQISSDHSNE